MENIIGISIAAQQLLTVVAPGTDALLLETADYLLLETGDKLLLE